MMHEVYYGLIGCATDHRARLDELSTLIKVSKWFPHGKKTENRAMHKTQPCSQLDLRENTPT
jgi:hypothetical protein